MSYFEMCSGAGNSRMVAETPIQGWTFKFGRPPSCFDLPFLGQWNSAPGIIARDRLATYVSPCYEFFSQDSEWQKS